MRRGHRFPPKTPIGQSVCLTPSPCKEFEPSRHNPFVRPTGARMRMPPIIPHAPCTVTPAYLLFPGIAQPFLVEITFLSNADRDKALCCRIHFGFIYRFTFSVCLPFSVTTAGLRQLYVSCRVQSPFKVYSLVVDEHDGTGYSLAFAQKNLQTSLPCGRSPRIFLSECRTPLCSRRAAGSTSEQTSNSDYTH